MPWTARLGGIAGLLVAASAATARDDPDRDPSRVAFFEQKVLPVLVKECYGCHSPGAKKLRGGFRLDTRDATRAGGDHGPAVVPGNPAESPLLDAIKHDGRSMPPGKKLPDDVIADIEQWIRVGASDPRDDPPVPSKKPPPGSGAGRRP